MKLIRAWWCGFVEANELYGSPMNTPAELLAYYRGRRLAAFLSFRRPFR